MIQYRWVIDKMNCIPKEGQLIDVVSVIYWTRYAKNENVEVSIFGTMNCESPSETDFTAYNDLTFKQVCQWLESGLDVSELDSILNDKINNIINPPTITLPLPFKN
jgi:hypothetical protein